MDFYGPLDLRLKHGTSMQIVGMSRSGKTQLSLKIALERNKVYNQAIETCIYVYNQYQTVFDRVKKEDDTIIFTNDIDELEALLNTKSSKLVIFDDFMLQFESKLNKYINEFFVHRAHHENISIILLQQVLYAKNARIMNLNAHYLIIFRLTRDERQIYCLGAQMMPENSKFIYHSYKLATKTPYSYLMIDLHPTTEVYARLRSSVFIEGDTVFYLQ